MTIYLPYHLGSGNRGCEGITRGIAAILGEAKSELVACVSSEEDYLSDRKLELSSICTLKKVRGGLREVAYLPGRVLRRLGSSNLYDFVRSRLWTSGIRENDVVIVTGGDIYCYDGGYRLPNAILRHARNVGTRTVLYGMSIEEKYLTPEVIDGLQFAELVVARDSASKDVFERAGIECSLYPDPAFAIDSTECELPAQFEEKPVVGLNFSNYTCCTDLMKASLRNLMKFVVDCGYRVCLIPHVFWKDQDDRLAIDEFMSMFSNDVFVLDSVNLSYQELRYIISKCEYFLGGRTHSMISAYSTRTPGIALGYSVKATGIARDISLPEWTVVNTKNIESQWALVEAFERLSNERHVFEKAYQRMDTYRALAVDGGQVIRSLAY